MNKMNVRTFGDYKYLSSLRVSEKDPSKAYMVVSEADFEENAYKSRLARVDLTDGSVRFWTSGPHDRNFIELDNGDLLFIARRDADNADKEKKKDHGQVETNFYRIAHDGGEAEKVFVIDEDVDAVREIGPERYLVSVLFNRQRIMMQMRHEGGAWPKDSEDYEVIEEIPFLRNGQGYTKAVVRRLAVYEKGTLKYITDDWHDVQDFEISEDKKTLAYIDTEKRGMTPLENRLMLYDLETKKAHTLSEGRDHSVLVFWGKDLLFAASDGKEYGLNQNHAFYLYHEGEEKCLADDLSLWNAVGNDLSYGTGRQVIADKAYVYYLETAAFHSRLSRMDRTGKIEIIAEDEQAILFFDVLPDGRLLWAAITADRAQELYLYDKGVTNRLTELNPMVYVLAQRERFRFQSGEEELDVFILFPTDYDPKERYPMILTVHGGPKTVYGPILMHEMELFAAQGYFVLFTNPHGSDGRGNAYADIRGRYGTVDYEDLMNCVDLALTRYPQIDRDNLFMTGGSYGGFMANWIIGHTDRFNAVVSQRSIANWFTEFGVTDIGYYFVPDQMGGCTPWSDPEKLWSFSPLKYADRVKTPTLFIHSDEDFRCGLSEGMQMFTALKYHGVESRLVVFHGENHELSRSGKPLHRVRRLEEILKFFDAHRRIKEA